jgi:hypothetical protein
MVKILTGILSYHVSPRTEKGTKNLVVMSNLKYRDVKIYLEECYGLLPGDFLSLKRSEQATILLNIQFNISVIVYGQKLNSPYPYSTLQPSSFKNTQKRRQGSTCKQTKSLVRRQRELRYIFCSILIEFGDLPISSNTMNIGKGLADGLLGDLPRIEKLEQAGTRNVKTHYHILVLLPYPCKGEFEFEGYVVKIAPLGEKECYKHLPMPEQVESYIHYLKKQIDGRTLPENRKKDLESLALVDWFELMHSQAIGESEKFRSCRTVNLGHEEVRFTGNEWIDSLSLGELIED